MECTGFVVVSSICLSELLSEVRNDIAHMFLACNSQVTETVHWTSMTGCNAKAGHVSQVALKVQAHCKA